MIRLLHWRAAVALLAPAVCGAILGWWTTANFNPSTLLLYLLGSFFTVLGMNVLNDYRDFRAAVQSADVKFTGGIFATAYHLLATARVQPGIARTYAHLLLLLGAIFQGALVLLIGWPVLFFYGLSLLFLYAYGAPPVRYGYRGWLLGEIGIFFSYGLLPFVGGYWVQAQSLSWLPLWVSIPFALLTVLLLQSYHLIHYRRDWLMQKRTAVVLAGPTRTLDISALLALIIYAALLCIISVAHLPLIALSTLAALPLPLKALSRRRDEPLTVEDAFQLHFVTVSAIIWTGLLFCGALLANRLLF
ncbi:MAG: prenyltransferase [Caldilineaceae bacterium]